MTEIELSESFKRWYRKLPVAVQKKVNKTLKLLAENYRYPSLQSKPVEGAPGVYEARIDQDYRITYERLSGDVIRLRVVGKHDEVSRKP